MEAFRAAHHSNLFTRGQLYVQQQLYPRGKSLMYPLSRRLGSSESHFEHFREERSFLPWQQVRRLLSLACPANSLAILLIAVQATEKEDETK
jgi:hypothetical protein